jgi:hypothetical protein
MRFTGNFLTEGAHVRGGSVNLALLFPLVACAVVAVASGAVILSLVASRRNSDFTASNSAEHWYF